MLPNVLVMQKRRESLTYTQERREQIDLVLRHAFDLLATAGGSDSFDANINELTTERSAHLRFAYRKTTLMAKY